jgi:hypothetical protein
MWQQVFNLLFSGKLKICRHIKMWQQVENLLFSGKLQTCRHNGFRQR